MDFVFWFRLLNVALAVFVMALCFLKLIWNTPDRSRNCRIASLGILTFAAAWFSYDIRYEPFSFRIPLITFGLLLASYGLHSVSAEPERFRDTGKYT